MPVTLLPSHLALLTLYIFQGAIPRITVPLLRKTFLVLRPLFPVLWNGGLKWNRTIDLTLIRRAL